MQSAAQRLKSPKLKINLIRSRAVSSPLLRQQRPEVLQLSDARGNPAERFIKDTVFSGHVQHNHLKYEDNTEMGQRWGPDRTTSLSPAEGVEQRDDLLPAELETGSLLAGFVGQRFNLSL